MINKSDNPVEWALLMYELDDAQEHINELLAEIKDKNNVEENDYKICIGHIYSHLNRATNSRNHIGEISDNEFIEYSKFPQDVSPIHNEK